MIQNKNLNFLGDNLFSDYMDILAKDNTLEIIDELIKAIANLDKWNKADLLNIPGTSNFLNLYESLFLKCTFSSKLKNAHKNPYIRTDSNFDNFMQSKSKGFRQDLRTTENRLQKMGKDWEFEVATSVEEKNNVLNALINFHTERQKTKVGTSIFDETKNINFFKDLIHNQSLSWKIHLSGIKYDKNFISASISIVHGKVFFISGFLLLILPLRVAQ